MRFPTFCAISSIVLPVVVAAEGGGIALPKIFGRNVITDLKARNAISGFGAPQVGERGFAPQLETRADTNRACGPTANGAVCAEGYCCSADVTSTPPDQM
jgi:hypothetical protein